MQKKKLAPLACLVAALAATACSKPYEPMDGVVTAYDSDGTNVTEVVAVLPRATLQAFVDEERNGEAYDDFDAEVMDDTVFQHIGVDYNSAGHGPPGVNDLPHVDAHFYFFDQATREAIDCEGEPAPDPDQLPEGVEANVDPEPFGGCVAAMGGHGALPYDRLTADMIYGYHGGELVFVEPMIDVELILAEEDLELDILRPARIPVAGRYPTRFFMRYTDDAFEFVLTDFEDGDA